MLNKASLPWTKPLAMGYLALLLSINATATTWVESEVDDPILAGETCQVSEPASYGSYIYHWPSKYDQVFWPYTDPHGIWNCEASGFVGLIGDFALTEQEKTSIASYLTSRRSAPGTIEETLTALEGVYALRDLDIHGKNHLKRLLARWYQELGNTDKATQYRQAALEEIRDMLAGAESGAIDEYQHLQYLYLAAAYSHTLDHPAQSQAYHIAFEQLVSGIKQPDNLDFADYLSEILQDISKMPRNGELLLPSQD